MNQWHFMPSPEEGAAGGGHYLDLGDSTRGRSHENIGSGDVSVDKGIKVDATDSKHIGSVNELILNNDMEVTHVVMRDKGLLSHNTTTIPLTGVDHVSGGVIYLNLTKQQVVELR
jgi:hypothetical protein